MAMEFSNDATAQYMFRESGRFIVKHVVQKGDKRSVSRQEIVISAPKQCRVIMQTDLGNMVFELYENTPDHLNNFLKLVEDEYYNGLSFHRVMSGFMIQAGDNATRRGAYKKATYPEITKEINSENLHYKGVLAAARMPDNINVEKSSSGTQFYIVHGRNVTRDELLGYNDERSTSYREDHIEAYLEKGGAPQLDFEYTVFGELIDGFDTLDKIASVETNDADKPIEDVRIIDVSIVN